MDTLISQLDRLSTLDPYALFSAILILCVVAGCLALVLQAIRGVGLAMLVAIAVVALAVIVVVGGWRG
jgi:hypothetical protein